MGQEQGQTQGGCSSPIITMHTRTDSPRGPCPLRRRHSSCAASSPAQRAERGRAARRVCLGVGRAARWQGHRGKAHNHIRWFM